MLPERESSVTGNQNNNTQAYVHILTPFDVAGFVPRLPRFKGWTHGREERMIKKRGTKTKMEGGSEAERN